MRLKFYLQSCILTLFLFALGQQIWAQGTVKGRVTDSNGEAIAGATVVFKTLAKGAYTNEDGSYTIQDIPAGEQVFSVNFLGFADYEETLSIVDGETITHNARLAPEDFSTDEILVVGYGTVRKRELVGSVSKIEGKDLNDIPGGSFETALQGKAPGVQVVQSSGAAGSGSVIRIRGIGSLTSGGDPLYVVDGIPITQDNFLNNDVASSQGGINNNPLSSLNPNDIESVEVLKDASAAAIYGSRGSNGVIIITTKRGKTGKPQFNFNSRVGTSQPTNVLEVLNTSEWLQIRQEAWENDGNVGRATLPLGLTYEDIEGVDTDWIDQTIHTGLKQEYNLSMRQGTEKVQTYVGLSYLNGESYQVGNSYERFSGRFNFDWNILPNMRMSLSTSLARGLNDRIKQGFAGGLGLAQSEALPIYPIKDAEDNWFNIYQNPVAQRELQDWKTLEWRTINNLQFSYKPTKDLDIIVSGSYDYMNLGDYFVEDSLWTTNDYLSKGFKTRVNNWSGFATASYDFSFLPKEHSLRGMAGLEYQESMTRSKGEEYWGVDKFLYQNPDLGAEGVTPIYVDTTFRDVDRWRFASVFFRFNYTWKDRLLAQVSYRRDGSSKYGPNRRFGSFPSVGLGYILSEEDFLKNSSTITFLKIKTSWGVTGNSDIDWRQQFPRYFFNNPSVRYNDQTIRYQSKLPNPDLKWEVANTFDVGFELGMWSDRLTFDFTYYYRLTSDAIINTSIQASSGIDDLSFNQNVGKIENKGVELGIVAHILNRGFKWTTRFNVGHNKNKVLEVGTATADALAGGFGDTRAIPGYPVNTNYVVRWSHVDPETGHPVYLDKDGNETQVYDVVNNRVPVGSGLPDFTGGWSNEFAWKNFDLSFMFYFSAGGEIYDDAAKRQLGVVTDWNMRKDLFNRWQADGQNAAYPKLTMDMRNWGGNANFWQNNHTLWLEKASYIRLRTLTLGYTIKPNSRIIRSMRLSLNATNIWTLTDYTGWDPEVARDRSNPQERNIGGSNVTYLSPPNEKTFTIGLNVDF